MARSVALTLPLRDYRSSRFLPLRFILRRGPQKPLRTIKASRLSDLCPLILHCQKNTPTSPEDDADERRDWTVANV